LIPIFTGLRLNLAVATFIYLPSGYKIGQDILFVHFTDSENNAKNVQHVYCYIV
jgi:hypothetical protein